MLKFAIAVGALLIASPAIAEDPQGGLPPSLTPFEGCWQGDGTVMGKAVNVSITAKPILLGAMLALDVDSTATSDAADRYQAHLLFGAAEDKTKISAFWSDSFGGAYTTIGNGAGRTDGFDIDYAYPDATYTNHWDIKADALTWTIVASNKTGKQAAFASYQLRRTAC